MSISGIQGQLLEVTVVGCNKLKDTEWFSRQDPYVIVEYGSTKNRTRTCTDGGRKPTFQEKFCFTLIEGLREINVAVWNSNSLTFDDFIGSGKVQLQKVLSQGYDDSSWTLQSKTGRYAGEVKLIMHYAKTDVHNMMLLQNPPASYAPSAPPYGAPHVSQAPRSYAAPPPPAPAPLTAPTYPPTAAPASLSAATYPHAAVQYPSPAPYTSYPPPTTAYPPSPYPLMQPSAYPQSTYPPSAYPPASVYSSAPYPPPPQPQSSTYPPPGSYPGLYPPPPY